MWAESFARHRCLVPAQGFYSRMRPRRCRAAHRAPREAPVRLRSARRRAALAGGRHDRGRFSLVTTEPNAAVAPVHNRMPLLLEPGETAITRWRLRAAARPRAVRLTAHPER
ncbi:MAG: SOS response-associated peptidase family protein [Eggerthellaceae bacterium]